MTHPRVPTPCDRSPIVTVIPTERFASIPGSCGPDQPSSGRPLTRKSIRKFLKQDDAIAVTEYGLLVALVAIALIAVVTVFGSSISSWFAVKTGQITTV